MGVNTQLARDAAFQKNLAWGQLAETDIAKWLVSRGNTVVPAYDIEYHTGKGPRAFHIGGQFAVPDLLVFDARKVLWIEAKHKTTFSWYRKSYEWQTGIDLKHWRDYLQVRTLTSLDVWLLFLHRSRIPSQQDLAHDCPAECPVGLFGNNIDTLANCADHKSDKHGRSGMIYWAVSDLVFIATLEEVIGDSP